MAQLRLVRWARRLLLLHLRRLLSLSPRWGFRALLLPLFLRRQMRVFRGLWRSLRSRMMICLRRMFPLGYLRLMLIIRVRFRRVLSRRRSVWMLIMYSLLWGMLRVPRLIVRMVRFCGLRMIVHRLVRYRFRFRRLMVVCLRML